MKVLALVTDNNDKRVRWLFDRILAMIAYDVELRIIFINDGCKQLIDNKIWKALSMYGVDEIYDFDATIQRHECLLQSKRISSTELKSMIKQADIIL
jgi:sulfur relay (sulfurtransferase) DsrF/TusC family protein